jgi:predicted transcriptional regulator
VKPLKSKVSITLDEDIIERVKELAENDDRSFSQYINMVLKEWVNRIDGSTEKYPSNSPSKQN